MRVALVLLAWLGSVGPAGAVPIFLGLGDLPGERFESEAHAVSADGTVVVGYGTSPAGREAFRWTAATGMVALGDLPGGSSTSFGFGVSADGSVIVGRGSSASGPEAFRWTQAGGMLGLGDLPGGAFGSIATDVSADGA
ncbi:MAG TPA: PEP-CTERM sorting domain-containing protein, partial [Myxococcota bacterium]|nr:PEP-CTERM sorting domain-containing protein [Myxococcota bacterium]